MNTPEQISDPGPAAHPAKNVPAGPGLPNTTDEHSRRSPMVSANEPGASVPGAIAGLLRHLPAPDAPPHERVAWQFRKADLLRRIAAAGGPDAQEAARLAGEADARGFELAREAVSLP